MGQYTYEELEVGTEEALSLTLTPEIVSAYAHLVGDTNPVHLDEEFASKSFFKKRVAHGMLVGGLVSAVLGTRLPGFGAIYVSQSFDFKRPVGINETITAKVRVEEKQDLQKKVLLHTWVENQAGKIVLDGQAWVLVRPGPEG